MGFAYQPQVDPDCPVVEGYMRCLFDPMTDAIGAPTGDIMDAFRRKHLRECDHCREYAAMCC
mgnify:CR=1 FL=1